MEARLQQFGGTTLINVLGIGGSGTTLLALMLGNSKRGFTPGETRVWYRPTQPMHFNFECWCRNDPCPVWERVGGFPEDEFYRRTSEVLGVEVIADSSKWLDWVRDASGWAERDGIRARNVHIWRDPVDLAYTSWRLGRLGREDGSPPTGRLLAERGVSLLRGRLVEYVRALEDGKFEPIVISYERLIDDPPSMLRALCDRLAIAYRPGQERFWEGDHHTLFGNQTARRTLLTGDGAKLELPRRSDDFERGADQLKEAISADEIVQETLGRLRAASL